MARTPLKDRVAKRRKKREPDVGDHEGAVEAATGNGGTAVEEKPPPPKHGLEADTYELGFPAKLSKCLSKAQERPLLTVAWLVKHKDRPWLCATDSYIMACVPLIGDPPSEWPVTIGLEEMKLIERKGSGWFKVERDKVTVYTRQVGQMSLPRTKVDGTPPDFFKLIPELSSGREDSIASPLVIGYNVENLWRCAQGIGATAKTHACKFTIDSPLRPARVELANGASYDPDGPVPSGPIGLAMPFRLND